MQEDAPLLPLEQRRSTSPPGLASVRDLGYALAKRGYHRARRLHGRATALESGAHACLGRRFRFDRRAPHRARLGARTNVDEGNVWSAHFGDIEVGDDCWFGLHNIVMGPLQVGDRLSTGQFVCILGPRRPGGAVAPGRTRIGDDVWISTGSVILHGVSIGANAVIGPNVVVDRDVPAGAMLVARPRTVLLPAHPAAGDGGGSDG